MNNDRFLTRVFDKQEKKMLYKGDYIGRHYILESITATGINVYVLFEEMPEMRGVPICDYCNYDRYRILPFADRFVPMMCWGLPDKNKKLIYESDIIKYCGRQGAIYGTIENNKNYNRLWVKTPGFHSFLDKYIKACEIIGNRWENPELNEKLLKVKA